MTGQKRQLNLLLEQLSDGVLLMIAFGGSYVLRQLGVFYFGWEATGSTFANFAWALFVLMPLGPIFLDHHGYYSQPFQKTFGKLISSIFKVGITIGLVLFGCAFFLKTQLPSRGELLIFAGLAPIFLLLRYWVTVRVARHRYGSERFRERVLAVGIPSEVARFREKLRVEQSEEMVVVAELNIETHTLQELTQMMHAEAINRVVILGRRSHLDRVQETISACEIEGVEVWLLADFIHTSIARVGVEIFNGQPMLVFRSTSALEWSLLVKKVIDRIGAVFLLIVAAPLFLIAMIGVRLSSRGSIFFTQKRSGINGKPFSMIKFRSMVPDAEVRHAELAQFNQMGGPVFKMEKDPRITPFGHWLRRTSVDELPQLINVLRGEMSLVGPRPLPLYEVEKFESTAHRRRLSVKPGLTCLWQIKGRNKVTDFQDWIKLDLQYIDNWSIWLDFKILLQTVPAVLLRTGAK